MNSDDQALTGEILEYRGAFTVQELCRLFTVDSACIVALVEEGIVSADRDTAGAWRFPGGQLRRVRTALRLQRDLEINFPGIALALELMDELDRVRGALDAATPRS
jgi:chaperone modulatory protein CbpM